MDAKQFLVSERGKCLLVQNGFKYSKKKLLKSGEQFWTCTRKNCYAKIFTLENGTVISRSMEIHNHDRNEKSLKTHQINSAVKQKAIEDICEKPLTILNSVIQTNSDFLATLTKKDIINFRNNIYNARRKLSRHPQNTKEAMRCAIFDCNNDNQTRQFKCHIRFHSFPQDPVVREQWVAACSRADNFNVNNARVCSKHFKDTDFERNLRYELLNYLPKRGKKLKAEAVPSLFLSNTNSPNKASKHKKKVNSNGDSSTSFQHVVVDIGLLDKTSNNESEEADYSSDGQTTPEEAVDVLSQRRKKAELPEDPLATEPQMNHNQFSAVREMEADEHFLLSLLPALQRLRPSDNATAKIRIQQVLFDIEFGEER